MTVSIPLVRSIGDVYILEWDREKTRIKIDRLHERADGVTGEVLITYSGGHLYHGRLNMLSTTSKTTLVNALTKRINTLDWHAMIEQACMKTLEGFRTGEPMVKLGTIPKRETPRYRLYPFILENERQIFYGFGGQGKSKMSQIMAMIVQCGVSTLGMKPIKGNVLILDWESSATIVDEFVKAFKHGMGIESEELPFYRYCTRSLVDDIDQIQKLVLDNNIQLAFIDSAGMAIGGDSESQEVVSRFFTALRSLKIATVALDHKSKKGKGIFGSIYKENIARSTFEFRGIQRSGSNVLDVGIYHRKANDIPKIMPKGFKLEFIGDEDFINEIIVMQQDVADIPEIDQGATQKQQIIDALKRGALSVKEISEIIQLSETQTRVLLNRHKRTFTKTDDNKWGLLSDYEI